MEHATQGQLAQLFGRSQSWVSRRQGDSTDPMPKDLAGAEAWGKRRGLIGQALPPASPEQLPATAAADVQLKTLRGEKLRLETQRMAGALIPAEEVEAREIQRAATFRRMACDFPRKTRAIMERHGVDAELAGRVYQDLEQLVVELLNEADPGAALKGLPIEEARAVLLAQVEETLKCL